MELQRRGIPTVTVLTTEFVSLGRAAASARGYASLPFVVVPHPFETLSPDEIRAIADEKFPEIVERVSVSQPVGASAGSEADGRPG